MTWRFDEELEKLCEQIIQETKEKPNQTPNEIIVEMGRLVYDTEIHILPADKGRNTVIWNTREYDTEAERQLED